MKIPFTIIIGWLFFLIIAAIMLGCSPSKPSYEQARHDVESMEFVLFKNVCFGVVRFYTSGGHEGASITVVPHELCE
jgi:hypothetical protein